MANAQKTQPATGEASFIPLLAKMIQKQDEIRLRRLREAAQRGELHKALAAMPATDKAPLSKIFLDPEDLEFAKEWRTHATNLAVANGGAPPYLTKIDELVCDAMRKAGSPPVAKMIVNPFADTSAQSIAAAAMLLARQWGRAEEDMTRMLKEQFAQEEGVDFTRRLQAAMFAVQNRLQRGLA